MKQTRGTPFASDLPHRPMSLQTRALSFSLDSWIRKSPAFILNTPASHVFQW